MPPRKNPKQLPSPSDRQTRSATGSKSSSGQHLKSDQQPSTSGTQSRSSRHPKSPKHYLSPTRDFGSDIDSSPEASFRQQIHFEDTSTPARRSSTPSADLSNSQHFTSASSKFSGFSSVGEVTVNAIDFDKVELSDSSPDSSIININNTTNTIEDPNSFIMNAEASAQFLAMLTAMREQTTAIQAQSQLNQQALQAEVARAEQARQDDLARHEQERRDQRQQQEEALQLQRDQTNAALLQQQNQSQAQLAALAEQLKNLGASKPSHPKPPAQKLEQFDLDKDGHTFKQWRSRWTTHLEFYGLDEIENDEERHKAQYHHLKPALSTKTLAWLDNRNLPDENAEQPEFILNHIDAFLKESVNVTMKVVDLVTMTRHLHEPTDSLLARINENASYVDAEQVAKDPIDFLSLVALQVAVSPELRVRIWQEKAKTYHEAAMICKQDELAHMNAKMNRKDGIINATSHYKQAQTQDRQAQQPHQEGMQKYNQYSHQTRGGYQANRGGYNDANIQTQQFSQSYGRNGTTNQTMSYNGSQTQGFNTHRDRSVSTSSNSSQPPNGNQDRGRSQQQEQQGPRPRSRSKRSYPGLSPDQCYSCGNAADHPRHSCPAYSKTCDNCGKQGHVKKICQQPQGQQAQQFQPQHNTGTLMAVFATTPTIRSTIGFLGALNSQTKAHGVTPAVQKIINKALAANNGYREIPPLPANFESKYSANERDKIIANRAAQMAINVRICHAIQLQSLTQTGVVPTIASIKERQDFAGIEALDTIAMGFRDIDSGHQFTLDILPDTGANVTAVSQKQAEHLQIEMTDIELRSADSTQFEVLGKAKCILSIKGREAPEYVYIIANLAKPLVSRRALKALGLLHPNWPHQDPGIYAVGATQTQPILQDLSIPPPSIPSDSTSFLTRTKVDNSVIQKTLKVNSDTEAKEKPTKKIVTGCGPELDTLVNEYPDLFDGRCTPMYSGEYTIELEPGAKPVSSGACRNIQLPYVPALKKELEGLVDQDIIEKITHATPWLHPIVVVPKKGTSDIRLCVDFTKINKYVKRPVNPQPTPWEVVRNLPTGTRHFAVFDALKGYHQIPLAEESRDLTAFMTPFGRYRYKRLAFGMNSAQDVFTLRYGNAVDKATDGLRATEDTLLRGSTTQELIENTRRFFDACRLNGITLNMRKIQWDKREVLFAGFLLDPSGYRIDPSLNKALSEFPVPTNQTDVRSFCGLANQLSNSSQDIATSLLPLSSLLKKGRMFQWLPEHQTAFENARRILSSEKTLAYYAPTRQTRLVTDASRLNGLGFVLKQLQDDGIWRPVQAGSRFLSSAETRYAMIELEMLAIAWACAKTANFIEGLPIHLFEIWTDHNPLIAILSTQTLPDISNKRLQRLKMKVDHLTFTIKWIQGKDNVEADVLSRHPCSQPTKEDQLDEGSDAIICVLSLDINLSTKAQPSQVTNSTLNPNAEEFSPFENADINGGIITTITAYNNDNENSVAFNNNGTVCVMSFTGKEITDERRSELRQFANNDNTYMQVVEYIAKGFPNLKTSEISAELQPFFKVHETLHLDSEGFVMNNGKLVVPQSLINTYLKRLLGMHQGGPKMLARARQTLWWPHMARDINNMAKTCLPCEESKPSNPAEVILSHEPALYPFQYCHMDIGQEEGRYYLITIDQFSGYPNIHQLGKTCKTKQIIDATAHFISLFSIPEKIYSDGGPQFLENGEFDTWCKDWGIRLVRSSPYMPRSNGIAEAAVKEMKKIIRANLTSSGNVDTQSLLSGLLMFRNTPRSPTNKSPAELLFGRQIRDSLPCPRDCLLPQYRYHSEERLHNHEMTKQNGPSRELPLLNPRAQVRIQNPITKKWDSTGEILDFGLNRREYLVRTGDKIIRRNRHFLKEYEADATPAWKQPVQAPQSSILTQDSGNSDKTNESGGSVETIPQFVYTTPPPTPIGVTTRWSSPTSRLVNTTGSVSTANIESPTTPNSVQFGDTAFKLFSDSDLITIPRDTTPAKPPILKTKTFSTPLTQPNNITIDLSLRHKRRKLPQELSLLQLALLSQQCPEVEQDYYKLDAANSVSSRHNLTSAPPPTANTYLPPTPPRASQPIKPTTTPYRHPNAGTRADLPKTNFDSIAARHERLQKTRQQMAQFQTPPPDHDTWLSTTPTSRPWNKPITSLQSKPAINSNRTQVNICIENPPRNSCWS